MTALFLGGKFLWFIQLYHSMTRSCSQGDNIPASLLTYLYGMEKKLKDSRLLKPRRISASPSYQLELLFVDRIRDESF